jgi:ribosomal protein S12 methylthiotransferase accessory factor
VHTTTDVKQEVETCVGRLAARGLEVLAVDLTTDDISELGLQVVKVLVPGSLPLDFGVRWPHLGGRRLYEAPRRMGYRGRVARHPAEVNLFPHPFP